MKHSYARRFFFFFFHEFDARFERFDNVSKDIYPERYRSG